MKQHLPMILSVLLATPVFVQLPTTCDRQKRGSSRSWLGMTRTRTSRECWPSSTRKTIRASGGAGCSPPYPRSQFLVTLRDVQERSGLTLFTNVGLSDAALDDFLDARPAELCQVENQFFGASW